MATSAQAEYHRGERGGGEGGQQAEDGGGGVGGGGELEEPGEIQGRYRGDTGQI